MIVGNPETFAIEFEINAPYDDSHYLALGLFILHIGGHQYGVRDVEATTFGNAVNAVETLIAGKHDCSDRDFAIMPAADLAEAYLSAFYRDMTRLLQRSQVEALQAKFKAANCLWPNSDEEFDDGSHVLHFNLTDTIRLVAFKNDDYRVGDLAEQVIEAEIFHNVLSRWLSVFRDMRDEALQRH